MTRRGAPTALGILFVCSALVAAACSDDDGADTIHTVAFLRAVAGAPSTEPAFVAELRQAGYEEGRNLRILAGDSNIAHPDPDEARRVAAGWAAQGVDVILALSSSGAAAARDGAPDTNVVFLSNDPVSAGLVDDESAPEGNLTGVTFRVPADRTFDLVSRIIPGLTTVGLAYPPEDPAAIANRDAFAAAADGLGVEFLAVPFSEPEGIEAAVAEIAAQGAQALVISTSPVATRLLDETQAAAAAHRLPVIANTTLAEHALVSLSPDTDEIGRQLARQTARLLAGTRPSAIPVEDPRRFVLTLNAGTAAELGITIPDDVVREANEVIR